MGREGGIETGSAEVLWRCVEIGRRWPIVAFFAGRKTGEGRSQAVDR